MFTSNNNEGFSMKFENGYTISVQFGHKNYCSRRSMDAGEIMAAKDNKINSSLTAEIAILNRGKFIKAFEDKRDVKGWVGSDEVATIIDIVSNASNADQIRVGINNMRPRVNDMFPGPINL